MRGQNCFICEADLYVPDPAVLKSAHDKSCYYGKLIQGHSDDWVFDRDSQGRIVRIGKGGDNCYNMCGISFFLKEDSTVIADAVANAWGKEGYEGLFWDEVVDTVLDRVNLVVHPVGADEIIEIDTVEELEKV
ncbi:MAG: hypothetical protein J6O55_00730 [Lachnospiraceae bacterium]|nr:hypothetical protein [Lachnospiraceae bacterium]